ncbi:hypothetical protein [Microvirga yunnanensis]|uniref:hypothetical protein n=1 Tax=Microvirga yunnanensis TaxID=2953740 RepID=UPI0021C9A798|nr:hypothetical protein [Microvirga sp. HBU67655]
MLPEIGDNCQARLLDRVAADREIRRNLSGIEADPSLEPMPAFNHEANRSHGCLTGLRGDQNGIIEDGLGRSVENVQIPNGSHPIGVGRPKDAAAEAADRHLGMLPRPLHVFYPLEVTRLGR